MQKIELIIKNSKIKLDLFTKEAIKNLEAKIIERENQYFVRCLIREKEIKLTPEEIVRQLFLDQLINEYSYPKDLIEVEKGVSFGREVKRADIIVYHKGIKDKIYIIIELKAPQFSDGKEQLKSYFNATKAEIGIWCNGKNEQYYYNDKKEDIMLPFNKNQFPNFHQTLVETLNKSFKYIDLKKNDELRKKPLKDIIQDLEDDVMANSGVNSFEEVFKLIFIKLYDELYTYRKDALAIAKYEEAHNDKTRAKEIYEKEMTNLNFRTMINEEPEDLKDKIQNLFDSAKKQWKGIFKDEEKILLTPSHLKSCISSLENIKLFNSNLDVIDDAFEYLANKDSKGEKGQYFTPRYVIDMCVKMLNPNEKETMIDTASGSCGFPIHTYFYVKRKIYKKLGQDTNIDMLSVEQEPIEVIEYVKDKIFAIDFDERTVRISKMLNLIAGDGHTNVLKFNTLDFSNWDRDITQDWRKKYGEGFNRFDEIRKDKNSKNYKNFEFDILMANPPFAGDIKEKEILKLYDLGQKKKLKNLSRDILFIERNLNMLKDGGRMAIVLPQGRFNNSSDRYIREFIADRARILAVVGLHGNVFKPHTGTKTSVMFLQKWGGKDKDGNELCPKVDDYNIFFATMMKPSKDNSGDKIYLKDKNGEYILDSHDHLVIDHDLYNHDELTQDGIAEAFIDFAKTENLSFWREDARNN